MSTVKLKSGYCTECGNTDPKPVIGKLCQYHYWQGKRKPIGRKAVKISVKETISEPSIQELIKLAVIVFHKWIKKRDGNRCISCGKDVKPEHIQAGHYRPSTYSSLRFDELNVNSECERCNCHDTNHLVGYRNNLIKKIGLDKVLQLESAPLAKDFKWDKEQLMEIINKYK